MKKFLEAQKGITLISLVVTITILLILASVATYTGINSIQLSKLSTFTAEMKIMQTKVNELYQEYKNGDETILTKGQDITNDSQAKIALQGAGENTDTETINRYRHYTLQDIGDLGLDGIKENEFLVSIQDRSVISYKGFEYEGTTYYTLDQLPNGLYNVDYNINNANIDFNLETSISNNGTQTIYIKDIVADGYVNKWQIRYRIQGQDQWQTTEVFEGNEYTIEVDEIGNYEVQVFNNERISSDIKTIKIEMSINSLS